MPSGSWPPPSVAANVEAAAARAPPGVWTGVGLFFAVPVLMIVALTRLLEPASDAGLETFEEDETGFFRSVSSLVISGFARRNP